MKVVFRARGQELGYWPGSEVRRLEVALRSQGAEMGVFLRVRGQWVERLFSRVRGQDLGAALSLHLSAGRQALCVELLVLLLPPPELLSSQFGVA